MTPPDESRVNENQSETRSVYPEPSASVDNQDAPQRQRMRSTAKTRKSADTRRRIMDVAAQIMLEQGNTAFQMSEISRRCNMSKGALYYYFSDKDDLVRAVFEDATDDLLAAIDSAVERVEMPEDALLAVCQEFAVRAAEGHLVPIAIVTELVQSREGTMARENMRTLHIIQTVEKLLEKAKETGAIRQEIDSRLTACAICGAFTFGALSMTGDSDASRDFAKKMLNAIVHGVGTHS